VQSHPRSSCFGTKCSKVTEREKFKVAKLKCKFTNKMKANIHVSRKVDMNGKGACLVCKPRTYISVSYKGISDLKSHLSSDKIAKQ